MSVYQTDGGMNMYLYRLKLIFKDKQNCIILACSFIIFLLVLNSLSFGAQTRSNIPIGLLNRDQSKSAEQLTEDLKQVPSLYVVEGEEQSLNELLYEEQISAIFIIEEGYEKSIQSGKIKELITMHYLKDNENIKILSDIFAGEMLYNICLNKGYNLYKALPEVKPKNNSSDDKEETPTGLFSKEEYIRYAQGLIDSADFDFAFDITMVNTSGQKVADSKMSNSVIYQQIIWGILGMLLSFVSMIMATGIVLEHETGLNKRIGITLLKTSTIDFSHLRAMLTVLGIFSLVSCILIGNKVPNFTLMKGCFLYLLLILFSIVTGLWFILLGKMVHKVIKYQYVGAFSIVLFGILGFLNRLDGFIDIKILNISKLIPNSWFIQGFTDIILNSSLQYIPYTSIGILIITAICFFGLNELIGYRQNR